MKKIRAWWFSAGRTLPHGDGREISVGATHKVKGLPVLCQYGLHGSRRIIDALTYAPGKLLWRTEHAGDVVEGDDKLVSTERRYLAVVDATEILRRFARLSALDVIDKWDAPEVVVRYLRTGDESIRIAAMTAAGTSTHIAGPPRALAAALPRTPRGPPCAPPRWTP